MRAPGGLAEIMYCLTPSPEGMELWRGLRAPVGGAETLFNNTNINEYKKIQASCRMIAKGVLHWRILCWGPGTLNWKAKKIEDGGPYKLWDSSRGNIFPSKIRIMLVPQSNARTNLTRNMEEFDETCNVETTNAFPGEHSESRFIRINNEWMSYSNLSPQSFNGLQRGIWQTKSAPLGAQNYNPYLL